MVEEQKTKKVLILDDDQVVLNACRDILEETQLEVVTTTSVEECFNIANVGDVDLFVTDIMMPELNGVEVVKRLRENNYHLTVIVITGYPSMDTARKFMRLGAYDYIPKPFTPEEFRETVLKAVGKKDPKKAIRETLVLQILDRTADDPDFLDRLYVEGSNALKDYDISSEAKAAIVSGDVKWIEENVGKLTEKQMLALVQRLETEIW
jgi:DNA-binding NtrC family response regulator